MSITAGSIVRFTGDYVWCGEQQHGIIGQVEWVEKYPPGIIAGNMLAGVSPFHGRFRGSGELAFGMPVPLPVLDLEPAELPPPADAASPTGRGSSDHP